MNTDASSLLQSLQEQKTDLLDQIVSFPTFRPGSLVGRYRKCGKLNCHCAREGDPGHGPSWSLTRAVKGKTVTKIIKPKDVETTQQQIAEHHRFQHVIHELIETNVKICDTLLETVPNGDQGSGGAEKGGSGQFLHRR